MENLLLILLNSVITSSIICLADRVNNHIPIFINRSFCFNCDHTLSWYDLLPVISAIMTNFKCRYCHYHYGFRYPLLEFFGTFIGLLLFSDSSLWITFFLMLFLALEDCHDQSIHANILIPWILYLSITPWQRDIHASFIIVILTTVLFLVYVRHSLGAGDIPPIICLTLVSSSMSFAFTLICATVTAGIYIFVKHQRHIPFIPFLLIGWLLSIVIEKAITYLL